MNFLEAKKILASAPAASPSDVLIAMSGNGQPLELFLQAHAAQRGVGLRPRGLPFGTLGQMLAAEPAAAAAAETELFLLLPWDFVSALDWRSGVASAIDVDAARAEASQVAQRLAAHRQARFAYLPAPLPPATHARADLSALEGAIAGHAARLGAVNLSSDDFSLSSYLASGCPIAGARLSAVAERLVTVLLGGKAGSAKLVITDLDETVWSGIVGEDGPDAVHADPEGAGFRHFLYQTMLKRLRAAGIVLCAVSRNDLDLAQAPLAQGRMPLALDDFVLIRAGYGSKSAHIAELVDTLNLGLDSVVFIDDNPIELAEVRAALPDVTCLQFPSRVEDLPDLLADLAFLTDRNTLTAEDGQRTEMYRRRMASLPPASGKPVEDFLRELGMVLRLRERSKGGWQRAIQLINKTNQFNLNGERLEEAELQAALDAGARLFTVQLDDRSGTHGEILACLVDQTGTVRSLVMSCRAFERRVEHAFLIWLGRTLGTDGLTLKYRKTQRNEPLQRLVDDPAFVVEGPSCRLQLPAFAAAHARVMDLFELAMDEA